METKKPRLKDVIKSSGFCFNKRLGQNFIDDENLLESIVRDSGVSGEDVVVEIGTGGGTLTQKLAKVAKKVYTFEVDKTLRPVLDVMLSGLENVEVCFVDVLRQSDDDFRKICDEPFKVVANLPYYITTPLIMRFVDSSLPVSSLTVMVQKEVADRLTAERGGKDYSGITLTLQADGRAVQTRTVARTMFYPSPNVDSAVVRLDLDREKLKGENTVLIKRLIKTAFLMRRKTLTNNLMSAGYTREAADTAIAALGYAPMVRGEELTLGDFVKLSRLLGEPNSAKD